MTRPAVVLLVRHAPTRATRRGVFPVDEPLDERGAVAAAALAGRLPADRAVSAPAQRCLVTARLAGYDTPRVDERFAELGFGAWSGRSFRSVHDEDPAALAAWLADPAVAPPGGEALARLADRVGAALDELREPGTATAVFTSGGPVKVAVLRALGAPPSAIWHVDVAPCSVTELHARQGGWTVARVNATVASRAGSGNARTGDARTGDVGDADGTSAGALAGRR